jgi:hypothetical protein
MRRARRLEHESRIDLCGDSLRIKRRRALSGRTNLDLVLMPAESINEDGLFLDDDTFESLRGSLPIPLLASYDFVDVLAADPDRAAMAGAA